MRIYESYSKDMLVLGGGSIVGNQALSGGSKSRLANVTIRSNYETDVEKSPAPKYIGNIGIESGAEDYWAMNSQIAGYLSSHDENNRGMKKKLDFQNGFSNPTKHSDLNAKSHPEQEFHMLNSETLFSFLQ